jgi:hypothetical protein
MISWPGHTGIIPEIEHGFSGTIPFRESGFFRRIITLPE